MSTKVRKVYNYTAIFERNELDGYTVTVPSLPGLVTEGKNIEEAKRMAEDAIRCYIEGVRKTKQIVPEEGEVGNFRLSVQI